MLACNPGPWSTLVSAATLGAARTTAAEQALWPPGVQPMPAPCPSATLLRAAVTTYLWQVAGARAAPGERPQIDPAPPPGQPLVCEAAAWRLCRILTGRHRDLASEWFALAAGRVLPAHWLPTVLPALSPQERTRFAAVLGPQALWLARQNPAWSIPVEDAEPSEERWINGTLQERCAELLALRRRDPDRGRAWLEQTWSTDPPGHRAALGQALLEGLSLKDENLLERMLDDRRKEVRLVAVSCLERLPGSQHARRNLQRLDALLVVEQSKRGRRKLRLRLHLPTSLDKSARRDGIDAHDSGLGPVAQRVSWVYHMISRTRLQHWTERFACDVPSFLDAMEDTVHGPDMLAAFTHAARCYCDPDWARALMQRWLTLEGGSDGCRSIGLRDVLIALEPGQREAVLQDLLRRIDAERFHLLQEVLSASELTWSAPSTALVIAALLRTQAPSSWRSWLGAWALRADVPEASERIQEALQGAPGEDLRRRLEEINEVLELRAAMRKELLGE